MDKTTYSGLDDLCHDVQHSHSLCNIHGCTDDKPDVDFYLKQLTTQSAIITQCRYLPTSVAVIVGGHHYLLPQLLVCLVQLFFQQGAKQPAKLKGASASGHLVSCIGEGDSLEDIEALSIALDIGATYEQLSKSVDIYLRCQARGSGEEAAPQAAAQSDNDIERALHKRQGACLFVCNVP